MKKKFCKRCLYSESHPFGLIIDDEGICSGCRVHEEKDRIDWMERWMVLEKIVAKYKKAGAEYDCIVPVSGGQDSYYMVYVVKKKLGLNPLLVSYNKYFNTDIGIRNLSNLRIQFDCDILYQNINPILVKKITRSTLRKIGSVYWPVIAGGTVFPVQTALRYKIPLIIWGSHQGIEQVGMFSYLHSVEMGRRYRKEHDLMGVEERDLLSRFDVLSGNDVWQYKYPSDYDLNLLGVRGIYLNNYVRWDPKRQHEEMIDRFGYRTTEFSRTFDCYDYVDCYNYMGVHDLLKLYKHGYSKVTDHACREIRFGRISREQGQFLVKKHEQADVNYVDQFCKWLGVDERSLNFVLDEFRNPDYWCKVGGEWCFRGWSTMRGIEGDSELNDFSFVCTDPGGFSGNYITIGKGYP